MKSDITKPNISALTRIAALGALAFLSISVSPAYAATLSRSVDVSGTPSAVWSVIGPFCAIKDWLPPVGTCTEKEGSPPERTLVTKDGNATFVETLTARSDVEHSYSYASNRVRCRSPATLQPSRCRPKLPASPPSRGAAATFPTLARNRMRRKR
jgi:Polyketide cyclase / dehydrase and lipid transport